MPTPARPDLVFHSIDELVTDADHLKSVGCVQSGQWTLPMILDHLGKAMNAPWNPEQRAIPWPLSIAARTLIHRMIKRDHYPAIKIPAFKAMRPDPTISLNDAHAEFHAVAEKLKACKGATISGTPFGTMRMEDFLKLHLLHGAHHLGFLSPR